MNLRVARLATLTLFSTTCLGLAACTAPDPTASVPAPPPAQTTAPAATTAAVAEHPELGEAAAVTEDSLTTAVTTHLQAEAARHGGSLTTNDPLQNTSLQLTLTTVHREGTRRLPDGRYFACADFKGDDGHTYDLDVFMKQDLNGLTGDEVVIHKQDGRPRYNWVQVDGIWQREAIPRQ